MAFSTKASLSYSSSGLLGRSLCPCGGSHLPQNHSPDQIPYDHWQFAESMPQSPTDLIDDLIKMGVYKPQVLQLADTLTQVEFKEALLLRQISGGNPARERLCRELIKEAGSLDQAMTAAFGVHATEFFSNTIRNSDFSRRDFLKKVAVAGALIAMSSCAQGNQTPTTQAVAGDAAEVDNLEKTDLRIGFIPITCATPIVMSEPLGFYEKYGLDVSVVRMPNWAAIRDSAIAGELDAYHMLSPMPIAITLGLGSTAFPIQLASIENINGQAITVAMQHRDRVQGPEDFRGFQIGVPFPYSMHNLLIRYYLATGGLNPDTDVQISAVPPPDSVARMIAGDLDAMLMPDPFNQRAVYEGVGFIHMLSKELWAGHPCCAFAASQAWIDENPNTFRAVNKAIIDACAYANDSANRQTVAEALIDRQYLNQPIEVVQAVLTGNFEDGLGNTRNEPDRIGFDPYPWKSFAKWISSQLVRWDLMSETQVDYASIADDIFMTDLARELSEALGQNPPSEENRVEQLKFDTFDPANPDAYVEEQIEQFNV